MPKCEIIHKYKVPSKYTKTFFLSVHQFLNMTGLAKAIGGFSLMTLEAFIDKGCQ
jgi:hypothetical protein